MRFPTVQFFLSSCMFVEVQASAPSPEMGGSGDCRCLYEQLGTEAVGTEGSEEALEKQVPAPASPHSMHPQNKHLTYAFYRVLT